MSKLIEYAPLLLSGALVTISLAVSSLLLATILGALGAWGKLSKSLAPRAIASAYTTLIRGVPDLVMMLLVYYGGQRLLNQLLEALGQERIDVSPFLAGVATIGFIFGAYLAETFRGAYLAIPKGQREAATSLGLRPRQTLWLVTLPQLIRHAIPGYGNVWLVLVKSTAIVSVIGLEDVVGLADKAAKSTREPFLFFLAVIGVFLAITALSQWLLRKLDARYSAHLNIPLPDAKKAGAPAESAQPTMAPALR
ncbi:MAG: ABC transporter permease [Rhodobacteraceae bacterium]|nr:ABC transporter permease [Paracoccaceae bacterium]